MREAVGATFIMKLMIIFIFFFAAFLAITINYSQAFRIKNQIINALEQQRGYTSAAQVRIQSIIDNSGYYRDVPCASEKGFTFDDSVENAAEYNAFPAKIAGANTKIPGVCIGYKTIEGTRKNVSGKIEQDTYYKVTTYVSFNLPLIGNFFSFPVKGETKVIYKAQGWPSETNAIDGPPVGVE